MFTTNELIAIREHPHLLGHLAGKTKLTELHSKWILYVWDTLKERCLQAHRLSYKTTSVIIVGCIWWLLWHPNERIGIVRKAFSDAAEVCATIRNIMKRPVIRELFRTLHGNYPEFQTQREGKLTFTFKKDITPEGNINAFGIDGSLTGKHLDKILLDDFVGPKDRTSKAERERTIFNVQEIRTNIIESGRSAAFIGTPWHKLDAWNILPAPLKFDVYTTKILSEKEIEEKKERTTPSLYTANYELRHKADEGLLFSDPSYSKRWLYGHGGVVAHLDAAFDGSNTNALTFFGKIKDKEGKLQGVGKCYLGHVDNWMDFIVAEYRKRRCRCIYIETNADKGYVAKALKKKGLRVKEYHESMNKHIKITTYLYSKWGDIEWVEDETDIEYMEQIIDYQEKSEPDDAPDSASSLVLAEFYDGKRDYNSLYNL